MPSRRSLEDTIAAVATPLGEGGLGVIRLSGAQAIPIIQSIFVSPKSVDLSEVLTQTCHFGMITKASPSAGAVPLLLRTEGAEYPLSGAGEGGEAAGEAIDQVVVTLFRAPHSYTGDDVVEISAHGSPYILEQILQRCFCAGARAAEPGEFTERAFLNGKIDLTQAEAVAELIHAKTEKARAAAMAQLEGRLAAEVRRVRDQLVPMLAHIEVGLDHSDEDHDFLQRDSLLRQCAEIQQSLDAILSSERIGKILRQGLRVALVGRPNVGKSSLLNALLKEERAIVTPIAGTTRDTLEESITWDGLPVVLTDTAGLRTGAQDPVEQLGIERSHQALDAADLVFGMLDVSEALQPQDEIVMKICGSKPHLWILNKCDLPRAWDFSDMPDIPLPSRERMKVRDGSVVVVERHPSSQPSPLKGEGEPLYVSAKTGEGLLALVAAVKQFVEGGQASAGQAQWMLNARHRDALNRAQEALTRARDAAQEKAFEECVALELQTALAALGEIIGETSTDDLLGQIFSTFCIGK